MRQVVNQAVHTQREYFFITNHFNLSAQTVADIYKQRWQVELFFEWIKQNLKIKSFLGTSKNAVIHNPVKGVKRLRLTPAQLFTAELSHHAACLLTSQLTGAYVGEFFLEFAVNAAE